MKPAVRALAATAILLTIACVVHRAGTVRHNDRTSS